MNRLAVAYYPEHVPETTWANDLRRMKVAGIGIVRVFEFAWSRLEPREAEYTLDWSERFIALAAEHGVEVVACTPTASAPPWLMHAHPDTVMHDGRARNTVGYRRAYCFSSPRFRAQGQAVVQRMVERYRRHPNVIAWQIDNELGFNFCRCGGCLTRYRAWLAQEHGTVQRLNAAWGLSFWAMEAAEWSDVVFGMSHPQAKYAERRFYSFLVNEFLGLFADQLRREHPGALVTTNFMGNFEQVDYFAASAKLDVVGWDMYPELYTISSSAMAHDLMRGLKNAPHWTLENTTGCLGNWLHLDGRHLGLIAIQAWAHGEAVHTLFPWRAFRFGCEQVIYGLVDQADRTTRIYDATCALSAAFGKLPELTMADFNAEVAFLYAYESFWAFQAEPGHPNYYFVIDEYYRAMQAWGVAIDVVGAHADLARYKVLVVAPHMVSDPALAAKLRAYVAGGGHLVMGPHSFTRDRQMTWHEVPPPAGLTDVFAADFGEGCYTADYLGPDTSCLGCDAASVSAQPPGHRRFPLTAALPSLAGAVGVTWVGALNAAGAAVWASYADGIFAGSPAITYHQYGAGSATLIGCLLESAPLSAVYGEVLQRAGVRATRTVNRHVEVVTLRRHTVYLNHTAEPCREPAVAGRTLVGTVEAGDVVLDGYGHAVIER